MRPAQQSLDAPPADSALVAWVRGVLVRMRERGAIAHEWFERYQRDDGKRYSIWGGRPREQGMPAFPSGRAAPGYPAGRQRGIRPRRRRPVHRAGTRRGRHGASGSRRPRAACSHDCCLLA